MLHEGLAGGVVAYLPADVEVDRGCDLFECVIDITDKVLVCELIPEIEFSIACAVAVNDCLRLWLDSERYALVALFLP